MRNIRFGTVILSVGLAFTVLGAAGGSSVGAVDTTNPQTFSGNVSTCTQAGLVGTQYDGRLTSGSVDTGPFTVTVVDDRYVTISDVSPGVVFSGVVLKGGDNYNVYSPPVAHMQNPLNNGGNVPALSHWFVCYTYTETTTTMTPTTEVDTEVSLGEVTTTTEVGSEGPTTTGVILDEVTTTTEVGSEGPATTEVASEGPTTTAQVGSEGPTTTAMLGSEGPVFDDLPRTGQTSPQLVVFGLFMVLLGGVIMWVTRRPISI